MIGQAPEATSILPDQWLRKIISWMIATVVVVLVASQIKGCAEERDRKTAEAAAAARASAAAVPKITLSCGNDKDYLDLPAAKEVTLVVQPTGKGCWTAWLRPPHKAPLMAKIVDYDPDNEVEIQMSFGEGEIKPPFHGGPLVHRFDGRLFNTVRWQNLGDRPVKVPLTIHY